MKLVIFDLDGTLTDTNQVDARCYVAALAQVFGLAEVNEDWSSYVNATDPGILQELCERRLGRRLLPDEMEAFEVRFSSLLQQEYERDAGQFRQIPQAGALLERLAHDPDWRASIATGGWRRTAAFKLSVAGLALDGLPLASGNEAVSREGILLASQEMAQGAYGVEGFSRVVSVGDGTWDIRAARALGLPFIGVGAGDHLARAGARQVVADFSQVEEFLRLLDIAQVPQSGGK